MFYVLMYTSHEHSLPPIMAKELTMTAEDFVQLIDVLSPGLASYHAGSYVQRDLPFCLDSGISLSNLKHGIISYDVPL